MRLPLYQIDAFVAAAPFTGNPAAVVPLEQWLDDELMQAIALENNLSETAFFVPEGVGYRLRWFTPETEVRLCGHATLASAFVIFEALEPGLSTVSFVTRSGVLSVARDGERLSLELPRWPLVREGRVPAALRDGLGDAPAELFTVAERDNWFVVFDAESSVRDLAPDMRALARLHPAGVAVTAPGLSADCVCRYFAPSYGIAEDPGTGSIHCGLVPYWAARLGKNDIHSRQLSARGAEFFCTAHEDHVLVAGRARKYLEGFIDV